MSKHQFYICWAAAVAGTVVLMFVLRPWIEGIFAAQSVVEPLNHPTPSFTMTDQAGSPFGSEDLQDTVWIADFIFTRCELACSAMTLQMSRLQDALRDTDVMLVSISVDPDYDRPEILASYAERFAADPERWRFLVGEDRAATWEMVERGFLLPVDDDPDNELMPISHSTKFVLIDKQGRLVDFYNPSEAGGFDKLLQDTRKLDR